MEKVENGKRTTENGKYQNPFLNFPFSVFRFPLNNFYSAILNGRIALYETGALESFSLGAPTVSVGNITVGGTGKTPLVAAIAEILAARGEKVCIISRGYKRESPKLRVLVSDVENVFATARQAGDEPFELARKLLGRAIVISDANRVAAAHWALEEFGVTAFVLDDAFQHLRARRDADIAVVDALNPFGNRKLVPFGILREPLENLQRADAVVITRANLIGTVENLKAEIRRYNADCPIFTAANEISKLIELKDFHALEKVERKKLDVKDKKVEAVNGKTKFLAFCGLGNPHNFFEQLKRENYDLTRTEIFPDHHSYRQSDAAKLDKMASATNADALLTTAKDAVKLKDLQFDSPCFVAESEMIFAEENEFRGWLTGKIKDKRQKFRDEN